MVAGAWSPPGAPPSWRLTAAQYELLAGDEELLAIAATIPPDRLPPLLFEAAATFLVLAREPHPLRDWFPRVGEPQPELGAAFEQEYRSFCLDHREELLELCATHRYQMNEVGRCADLVPALSRVAAEDRELVLIDLGTGAGLALQLDLYRYVFRDAAGGEVTVGDPDSPVRIETEIRGSARPPISGGLPRFADRIGIDVEPLDVSDPGVRAWLAACIPQEVGAVTRFHYAAELAITNPARRVRGDAVAVLGAVLEEIEPGPVVCLVDTYVHVFFGDEDLERFRALVDAAGARRDLEWISIDPLVPMGPSARRSVLGIPVPDALVARNADEGVFGVIGRLGYRAGGRSAALLGIAHPGAAWLEWLEAPA
jgi:hypothetical protein